MAEYICFEASASDESDSDEIITEANDVEMIDNSEQENNDASFFRFCNQTSNPDKILEEIAAQQASELHNLEASNYLQVGEEDQELEIDESASSKINIEGFKGYIEVLKNPIKEQSKVNSFISALFYAINYSKNQETEYFEIKDLRNKIGAELFDEINKNSEKCILDLDVIKFEQMCLVVNDILIQKSGLFLRVHEKKNKFRYIFHRTEEKNNTYKTLSSCINTKFNGFNVAAPYLQKEIKRDLYPIDIVYKPVKHPDEIIECYFATDIRFAYYGKIPNYKNQQITNRPYECYYCQKFFEKKAVFDRHIKTCSGKPGVVYSFEIQNIVTFEDNIKYQGDVPFSLYADFETTAPTSDYLCPENDIMFSVSYSIAIGWHPKLNLPRQFVVRGFNHTLEELTDVSYLTSEQLGLRKQTTTEQLRDAAIAVSQRKNKNAINILFNIELKFIYDILMKWFKFKIKSCHLEIPQTERIKYERLNPLTDDTKCVICHFPMQK